MDNETLLRIIQILINKIGIDNFDIFDKIEIYQLTNGEFFDCEEVLEMLEKYGSLIRPLN